MLKKLYKHEYHSLFRVILPIYAGLFFMAGLARLTDLLPTDEPILDFLVSSTTVLYVLAIFAMIFIVFFLIVMRFCKHLLSKEGYLTFSLPVRAADHLNCKLVTSATVLWLTVIAMLTSLFILFVGTNAFTDFQQGARYVIEYSFDNYSLWKIIVILVEFLFAVIAATAYSLLLIFGAICIGQQFKKRVGAAVLSGFIIYAVIQTVGVVIIGIITTIDNKTDFIANMNLSPFWATVLVLGLVIVWNGLLSAILYYISRKMLTEKLNLQ